MKDFPTFLIEQKNLHLEHLEDELFNRGSAGAAEAISFINSLTDMLKGESKKAMDVTVKWDGAPAVFTGINPENGKFFVATKSLFNKTPKINYTDADIDANHKGGLAEKLKVALFYRAICFSPTMYQRTLSMVSPTMSSLRIRLPTLCRSIRS